MSRLFSRLDIVGREQGEHVSPLPFADAGIQPDPQAAAGAAVDSAPMPPLVPGYALPASLTHLRPSPAPAIPAWPFRLWIASLLLLVGLSLTVLFMPAQLLGGRAPAVAATTVPAGAEARAPVLPAPPGAAAVTAVRSTSAMSAVESLTTTPSLPVPAAAPPGQTAARPSSSADSIDCSEAMRAMNFCRKLSP